MNDVGENREVCCDGIDGLEYGDVLVIMPPPPGFSPWERLCMSLGGEWYRMKVWAMQPIM